MVVVQADPGMQRQRVVDAQVDVDGAGHGAGLDRRGDFAVGEGVGFGKLRLHRAQVGHLAFLERRDLLGDDGQRVIF